MTKCLGDQVKGSRQSRRRLAKRAVKQEPRFIAGRGILQFSGLRVRCILALELNALRFPGRTLLAGLSEARKSIPRLL